MSYLKSRVKFKQGFTDESGPEVIAVVESEYKVSSIPVALGVSFNFPVGKFNLIAELSGEYHFARQSFEFPGFKERNFPVIKQDEKQNGLGFAVAAGPKWKLSSLLTLVGKIGYRFAEISDFEGNADGFLLKDVTFDFSGIFFDIGIGIHP